MAKKNEDIDNLICAKTAGMPRPVYGSVRADCLICKSPVWESASGSKGSESLKLCCIE